MKSMHSDCCKNKVHLCKSDSHKSPTAAVVTSTEISPKVPVYLIASINVSFATTAKYTRSHLRPGDTHLHLDCPLFISNRVFRI